MKKCWPLFLFLLFSAGLLRAQFVPGKLFVKLKSEETQEFPQFKQGQPMGNFSKFPGVANLLATHGATALFKPFKTPDVHVQHIYEVHFNDLQGTKAFLAGWMQFSFIEYAEQIPTYALHYTPNDLNILQWGLNKVNATSGWDINKGVRTTKVGCVDDAMLMGHEDLAPQVWTNLGEIAGDSMDNDSNGFIDDVHGYDLADDDPDANPPSAADDNAFSHGTHTSGIAGASTDNNVGVASLGFNVTLMPIKTKTDTSISSPYLEATYTGIDYAITNHADVVNMSFGSAQYNYSMAYLILAGYNEGIVFVASAGNTGSYAVQYPAAYEHVISAGSTEWNDAKSGFSTWHWSIDVMAPGGGIYSSVAGGFDHYGFKSGTSMSAPMVTGLVALMLSIDSTLTPDEVLTCLQSGCDNIDADNAAYVGSIGAGRINAFNTLTCAYAVARPDPAPNGLVVQRIFPNPATEQAMLSANLPFDGAMQLEILDLHGKVVTTVFDGQANAGRFESRWQRPAGCAAGMYLVRWRFEGAQIVEKMVLR
jgi:subtilisin family serine protease